VTDASALFLGTALLVAFLAAAGWTFRRPQRALLVLAALVPFDGLLVLVPHPAILQGWKEAMVLGAAGVAVLSGRRRSPTDPPLPAWVVPIGALVVLAAVTGALSGPTVAVVGMKVTFFFLLLPFVLWRCPFTARDRDHLVTILMTTGVVTALVGIAQTVVGAEALVRLGYRYNEEVRFAGDQLRAFSTFTQPFPFAFFLVACLLVGVPVALADRRRIRNRLFLLATPVLAVALYTSVVRAGVLGLGVGAAWLLARRGRSVLRLALPVLVLGAAALGTTGVAFLSADSLQERVAGWTSVVDEAADAPVGSGIGTTGAAAERAGSRLCAGTECADAAGDAAYQPDNYYVKLLLELGPLGLWLFAAALALVVADGARIRARCAAVPARHVDAALADGITAATLAASVAAVVSTYWEIFPADVVFWLLQGVLLSIRLDLPASSATRWRSAPVGAASRPTSASFSASSVP